MRAFVQRSLAFALVSVVAIPSGRGLAQPPEEPEEIIVRAKPLNRYRAEIEQARDEMIRLFNEANEDDDNDVRCRYEAPTGSRIPVRVCFSAAQDRASANAARDFLQALFRATGSASGTETGIGSAQNAVAEESRAMVEFEEEWRRVMGANQEFFDAVINYRELENEFDRARGATIRIPIPVFALKGPQCEASTYTEYEQRGNVARVTGRVSISACPAGTTGKFAVVARVRDEAGASTPIEFSEMWQSADAQDYIFYADYPIGDNVFLERVRVRNLTCNCDGPTQ
ncbi:MAG TPA: hypothetical protein VKA43_16675 [Gammaproteobacteria bacterium]|nr:hypothetical protein [Gammaproteobacteria bacterium]